MMNKKEYILEKIEEYQSGKKTPNSTGKWLLPWNLLMIAVLFISLTVSPFVYVY